jgi:hypothetical protein
MAVSCSVCFGQTNSLIAAAQPLRPPTLKLSDRPARGGGTAANVSSQTQLAPPQGHLFPPPELKMHELPFITPVASGSLPRQTGAFSSQMSSDINPAQTAVFNRIEREGLLKPRGPTYDSDVERKIAAAFRPQIIHVGHVQIYSPIVTAIARRNPLCLFDPMVLGISF